MARAALALFVAAAGVAGGAAAQDASAPDLDFLEYLGSWQDGDEEWLVVADEFMGRPGAAAGESRATESEDTGGKDSGNEGADRDGTNGAGDDQDEKADASDED